jgi:hypothetical protein
MDATELFASAERLDGHDEVLRARARLVALHGEQLRWRSPAATRFRAKLEGVVADLALAATGTAALADRIRIHAGRVADSP